jgi:hypothetical protein
MDGGAARRNWATPVAPLAGEGVRKDEGLTMARIVAEDGAVRPPARGAAESGGGSRLMSGSGATATTTEQALVVEAHVDAKGGSGIFGWRWKRRRRWFRPRRPSRWPRRTTSSLLHGGSELGTDEGD